MARYAQTERRELADLFLTVGPDAPTLNAGWTARDLAAHLVVRERRPDALPGLRLPSLSRYTERVRQAAAAQPYPRLIDQLRRPPWWSPLGNPLTDGPANTLEFFIHHEDVRRARPDWRPRELPPGQQAALWKPASLLARLRLRRFPAALLIQAVGFGEVRAGAGGEPLRLEGAPAELVIFLSGRQSAARVHLDGTPALAERLRTAPLGL
ncbi:TIGR03085 family protein [Micromonospora pattaloongensis]|uniref:TIGR03085 family protein n=1 Tax=Micromonospora pattaloongensis TaxID=405436 RepID=A0A1H3Q4U2_9ACTN|nr:TIGR03085 family metal-binding protein [Micromonospora pattaloongensis]SDZ08562.1 TIGR03085 family protein [Micromonospora pattaloongensis]